MVAGRRWRVHGASKPRFGCGRSWEAAGGRWLTTTLVVGGDGVADWFAGGEEQTAMEGNWGKMTLDLGLGRRSHGRRFGGPRADFYVRAVRSLCAVGL